NSPLTIQGTFDYPGKVTMICSPWFDNSQGVPVVLYNSDCSAPTMCLVQDEYYPAGAATVTWADVDSTGAFRGDTAACTFMMKGNSFAQNLVLLYNRKPRITNLAVTPALYNPGKGNQSVNFTLWTYQNQTATITITFINQTSLSVLRTVTQNNVAPGSVSIPWDGKADNGAPVAPGGYTVTVTATNSTGQGKAQILTKILY